ncbi:DNA-directed RNA polymerase subunit P [Candidatus Woesearchaeota archaeon]|nr:DNA-directed RNA polymerase subunit P [Candidatus Woesearchaeota archaeon]
MYKCFFCGKEVSEQFVRKRIRCPYCGSKVVYKPRLVSTKVLAR